MRVTPNPDPPFGTRKRYPPPRRSDRSAYASSSCLQVNVHRSASVSRHLQKLSFASPDVNPQHQSPLMRLPVEIQDAIYRFVMVATPTGQWLYSTDEFGHHIFEDPWHGDDRYDHIFPAMGIAGLGLLTTCKIAYITASGLLPGVAEIRLEACQYETRARRAWRIDVAKHKDILAKIAAEYAAEEARESQDGTKLPRRPRLSCKGTVYRPVSPYPEWLPPGIAETPFNRETGCTVHRPVPNSLVPRIRTARFELRSILVAERWLDQKHLDPLFHAWSGIKTLVLEYSPQKASPRSYVAQLGYREATEAQLVHDLLTSDGNEVKDIQIPNTVQTVFVELWRKVYDDQVMDDLPEPAWRIRREDGITLDRDAASDCQDELSMALVPIPKVVKQRKTQKLALRYIKNSLVWRTLPKA